MNSPLQWRSLQQGLLGILEYRRKCGIPQNHIRSHTRCVYTEALESVALKRYRWKWNQRIFSGGLALVMEVIPNGGSGDQAVSENTEISLLREFQREAYARGGSPKSTQLVQGIVERA